MSAFDIVRAPSFDDKKHLTFIHKMPCIISGQFGVDPAHIRYSDHNYVKRLTGGAERPHDMFVVPLSRFYHDQQHDMAEREFWHQYDIDPVPVAVYLYAWSRAPVPEALKTRMGIEFVNAVTSGTASFPCPPGYEFTF